MNLTPLQRLLPEWIITDHGINDDGPQFGGNDMVSWQEIETSPRLQAILSDHIERALLKREGACCVTTSSCNNEDCSLVTHTAQVALFEDEAIKEWGHTTKLAALLEVIERLPGLGGDEK